MLTIHVYTKSGVQFHQGIIDYGFYDEDCFVIDTKGADVENLRFIYPMAEVLKIKLAGTLEEIDGNEDDGKAIKSYSIPIDPDLKDEIAKRIAESTKQSRTLGELVWKATGIFLACFFVISAFTALTSLDLSWIWID